MTRPLEGITILDSAHQYPGPYCSMLLGDLGAKIIKIERPGGGDAARRNPGFFRSLNRNKKSISLDFKKPAAKDILLKLVDTADVFTEGFRPGVVDRLGIGYEDLKKVNPRLIYCSISGYGQTGPYRDMPGHDLNYLSMSGLFDSIRDDQGNHVPPGIAIGDLSSGMFAVIGIMAALMARAQTGKGQYVDVSMFDGLLSWMSIRFGIFFQTGSYERPYEAGYGVFKGSDGQPFSLGIAHEDWFWKSLCNATGLTEYEGIKGAERIKRRKELQKKMQAVFSQKPAAHWIDALVKADVPIAPIKTPDQVVNDPHVLLREMIKEIKLPSGETNRQIAFPVKFSETPAVIQGPPPELGEHTEEILIGLGYSLEEAARFKDEGAI
jgi:crotonobetainyl-CoA:carnitine CoA-transferase CaiB-like acyl-CoA transferase